jgi:hypothetical protein
MIRKALNFYQPCVRYTMSVFGLLAASFSFAQTGIPAGVGNSTSNKVWLDASHLTGLSNGARVSSWSDRSGNNWNANQSSNTNRPTYITGGLNGHPIVNFNRSGAYQFLEIRNTGIGVTLSNSNTIIVVSKSEHWFFKPFGSSKSTMCV